MLSVFTEANTYRTQNPGQPLFSLWREHKSTDTETNTEDGPGYQAEDKEEPVQNKQKEETIEKQTDMATTQGMSSFDDIVLS